EVVVPTATAGAEQLEGEDRSHHAPALADWEVRSIMVAGGQVKPAPICTYPRRESVVARSPDRATFADRRPPGPTPKRRPSVGTVARSGDRATTAASSAFPTRAWERGTQRHRFAHTPRLELRFA